MEKDSTPRSGSSIADFDYKCDVTEEDWDYSNFQTDFNAREFLNEIVNGIQTQESNLEESKVPLKNNCQRLEIIEVLPTQTAEVCEETTIITNVIYPNYNKFKLEEAAHFGFNMQNGRVEKPNFTKKQTFSKPKTPENLSVLDINDLKQSASNKKDVKASKSAAGVSNVKNNAVKKSQPVASTSSSTKKRKKMKKEDETVTEDVRSIAQCLLMNSLNLCESEHKLVNSECNNIVNAENNVENNNLDSIGRNYAESTSEVTEENDLKTEKENELSENVGKCKFYTFWLQFRFIQTKFGYFLCVYLITEAINNVKWFLT